MEIEDNGAYYIQNPLYGDVLASYKAKLTIFMERLRRTRFYKYSLFIKLIRCYVDFFQLSRGVNISFFSKETHSHARLYSCC